jgi:hypothetical protein
MHRSGIVQRESSSLTSGKTMTGNSVTTVTSAGIQTNPVRQLQQAVPEDMAKEHERELTNPNLIQSIVLLLYPD